MILNLNKKLNITLCGMMGSGKSTIGKLLANKINYNFIDIDKLIEKKTNKSINAIFEDYGEIYFRDLEEKITIDTLNCKKTIVSLGGGAVINNLIRNYIKKNSYNIYLKVEYKVLEKRLKYSKNRPLINNINFKNNLIDLIKKRENLYQKADLIIKNEKSINDTVNNILIMCII